MNGLYKETPIKFIISILILTLCWYSFIPETTNYNLQTTIQDGTQNGKTQTGKQETKPKGQSSTNTSWVKQETNWNTKVQYSKPKEPTNSVQSIYTWTVVYVKWFPKDSMATKIATYEYKISGGDLDFLATMKAENGWYNMYQQSNVYKNGKREESYWLCQMMRKYHPEVNTKIFRESWEYQVEICWKKYKWGTKFYGFNVRNKYKNDFTIIK